MVTPKNSTDLERAPGARSIADEFSGVTILVQMLERCESTGFHFHAAPFGTRSLIYDTISPSVSQICLSGSRSMYA